jgi:DNA helicase IV
MLMPHFEYGYTLADKAERAEQEFFVLTEQQCQMLEFLQFQKRALVQGCAGSGKTLMAIKKAEQLGAAGKSVLLLCFNRLLGQKLAARTAEMPGVTSMTYHRFCTQTLEDANCLPEIRGNDPAFWADEIPDALDALLTRSPQHYDAVVVDEAQDFKFSYWASIAGLVEKDGWFYIFYDPGQNLFASKMEFPFKEPMFPLTFNCRNTRRICEFLQPLSVLPMEPKDGVPEGDVPISFAGDAQQRRKELARVLHDLTTKGKLDPDEIVVLGGHRMANTCIAKDPKIGKFTLTENVNEDPPNAIRYYTPMKFKGLEARAVILLDVDDMDERWSSNHIYTAASRAKYSLHVVKVAGDN